MSIVPLGYRGVEAVLYSSQAGLGPFQNIHSIFEVFLLDALI